MKKILATAGLFLAVSTASAQGTLEQGNMQLNAGVGISSWGIPVTLGLDYGIARDFTVGVEGSYRSKKETFSGPYGNQSWKHTGIGVSVNGNYHFNRILKLPSVWDFYAGLSVGYYNWTTKHEDASVNYTYNGSYASGLGIYGQVGGRYFFSNNFGLNLELGAGHFSGGKFGITYKF